jgi:photosystem II stability/assembly factor-like uncharacterized protein
VKNKSIGSLILLAILAPSCGSGGGGGGSGRTVTKPRWEEMYRKPTSVDLRGVRFGNPNQGIAAGKFGTFVRTDDGGTTWRQLESTPVTLYGDVLKLTVLGTTTFAVGGTPAGATTYGGNMAWQSGDATTFVQPDAPVSSFAEPWVDVALISPASGTVAAATLRLRSGGLLDVCQGSVLSTIDSTVNPTPGNASWTAANGLAVVTTQDWFVCGEGAPGLGQIRVTSNAGNTSGPTTFSTPTLPAGTKPLRRLSMISTTRGYACGDQGALLQIDQTVLPVGTAWTTLPGNPITENLKAIQFLDQNTGWVAGSTGAIYRVKNASTGSPVWLKMTTGTFEDLYDIHFSDADNGYAVGNNGVVLKTSNGTATPPTWTIKSGPVSNPMPTFTGVEFSASGSVGLATGLAGGTVDTLLRSLDGGATWSSFSSGLPVSTNLTAVSIPRLGSDTVGFVGTDTGTLYFNSDILGTGSWQSGGTLGAGVKAILFPKDDSAGIAVGVGGNVAVLGYTTLGGMTVNAQTPTGSTIYAAACDPTGNTLYVGGAGGYLVKSTNGGANWNTFAPVSGAPAGAIRSLQAPTGTSFTLFAAVDDDKVYSLSAGGSPAWASQTIAGFGLPVSLAFIDDLEGWAVTQGATGGVLFTLNGGATWFRSVLHVPVDATAPHTLNAIWMFPSRVGMVAGANGVLMRTTTGGQ